MTFLTLSMIFYFSGTGNSLWVAERLGKAFGEKPVPVAGILKAAPEGDLVYSLGQNGRLILVFPVHSWGPAVLMSRFLKRLRISDYSGQPVYAVCTCGDTCGQTDRIMREVLASRGLALTACWSVRMPNDYILMKGFGVDSDEVRDAKLSAAPATVDAIIAAIREGKPFVNYVTGTHTFVKSRIINALFRKFLAGPDSRNQFYVTDACIGCGQCASVCPVGIISMKDGRPVWGRGCVQCSGCINRCPVKAIEYGEASKGQGRYHHPDL